MIASSEAGYAAMEEAVAILRDAGSNPLTLANALYFQSLVAVEIGRPQGYEAARETYEIGLSLKNREFQHMALGSMARWALTMGELEEAAGYLAEARRLGARLSIPTLILGQTYVESLVTRALGDLDGALRALNEGIEALRQTRSRRFSVVLDSEMGHTLRQSGDLAGALEIYRRTILEWQDMGRRSALANQLECFAFIAVAQGQFPRAARHFGAAEMLRETMDGDMSPEERKEYDAHVAALREALAPAAVDEAWQVGRGMDLDTAVSYALTEGDDDGG